MTALLISAIVWGIVAFMATDDYCKTHEKNALRFLVVLGSVLTVVGVWGFEVDSIRQVSLQDWALVGFFPIVLLYLRLKAKLVKKQSEVQGRDLSLVELDLDAVPEKDLVRQFRNMSAVMWSYAVLVLGVHIWVGSGISI